jgi:hypothetical protein
MNLIKKILAYEPVMSLAFATSALAAVAQCLRTFGVYDLTEDQTTAVLTVLATFGPVAAFVVRQEVTPTVKL